MSLVLGTVLQGIGVVAQIVGSLQIRFAGCFHMHDALRSRRFALRCREVVQGCVLQAMFDIIVCESALMSAA